MALQWLPRASWRARVAQTIRRFHELYYALGLRGQTWENTFWLGTRALKCPLDLWVYQEIITELAPDLIIETGTAAGGSALYLATICEALGHGHVATIDQRLYPGQPEHPRIIYLRGASTSPETFEHVRRLVRRHGDRVMVVLDSDHHKDHVLREMLLYAPLVSRGSYLIVEDTNMGGHPVRPWYGPGPTEAVWEFLLYHPQFAIDKTREKFLLTFNPNGYLKRVN